MHGNFGLFAGKAEADFLSDIYQPFECMTDLEQAWPINLKIFTFQKSWWQNPEIP